MSAAAGHPPFEELLAYWLAETDAGATDRIEQHLMACDACGEQVDELAALSAGVKAALRAGHIGAMATDAFVRQVAARGLRVREYRVERNGSVQCTVGPDDDLLVAHMAAPLAGVQRVDAVAEVSVEPGVRHRLEDIPFDPRQDEVVLLPRLSLVRAFPQHTVRLQLLAVDADGVTRELGHYTFHHRA